MQRTTHWLLKWAAVNDACLMWSFCRCISGKKRRVINICMHKSYLFSTWSVEIPAANWNQRKAPRKKNQIKNVADKQEIEVKKKKFGNEKWKVSRIHAKNRIQLCCGVPIFFSFFNFPPCFVCCINIFIYTIHPWNDAKKKTEENQKWNQTWFGRIIKAITSWISMST